MFARSIAVLAFLSSVSAAAVSTITQAKALEAVRRLEDADNVDYTWMNGYTVMYENCFPTQSLATFRLCPADSTCHASCDGGGEYILDLKTFIDDFTEAQMGGREYRCEMARENCGYDDDALCYADAGLDYCKEGEDEFNLQEWIECAQFDDNYYIGPYCASDNYNIHLGLFTDADCLYKADVSFSETYGYVLDYSEEAGVSIIADECADCKEHHNDEDNDGEDNEDADDVIEQCEELYETASKCEKDLDTDDEDDSGCDYIAQLKKSESVTAGQATVTKQSRAGLWFFLILLALFAVGGCYWYSQNRRASTTASEGLMS